MEKRYHIVGKESSEELGRYLARNGQVLLPMVELIEQSKMAVDELIDVLGRAQIEAVLRLSAERIAGPSAEQRSFGHASWTIPRKPLEWLKRIAKFKSILLIFTTNSPPLLHFHDFSKPSFGQF